MTRMSENVYFKIYVITIKIVSYETVFYTPLTG